MPDHQDHTISELATLAGVTPRTIRYYVSIGLLPSPAQAGPGTRYGEGHLARLRLIRRLQREHLPLAEITQRLDRLDDAAVEAVLAADEFGSLAESSPAAERSMGPGPGSALEYILRLKEAGPRAVEREAWLPRPTRSPAPVSAPSASPLARQAKAASFGAPEPEDASVLQRTQWERVTLGSNVELHVRRPLSRLEQKQVERLIRLGRELLEGGTPT